VSDVQRWCDLGCGRLCALGSRVEYPSIASQVAGKHHAGLTVPSPLILFLKRALYS